MIRFLGGDCRAVLPTLPDRSVQCVVTSPPYFGLRDYGTGTWNGGDPDCDHTRKVVGGPKQTEGNGSANGHASKADKLARTSCACGATRVDSQIGLEPTPALYVAEMVAVFREVRRVLRDDGTVWLNLGSSYAANRIYQVPQTKHPTHDYGRPNTGFTHDAGGKRPNPSPLPGRAPACDSGGRERSDSQAPDSSCYGQRDGLPRGSPNRLHHIPGNGQQIPQTASPPLTIDHGSERQDCAGASPDASPPYAQASTTPASSPNALVESDHAAMALASLQSPPPYADDVLASARKAQSSPGTASRAETSDDHKSGMGLSSKACSCGSCGICWSYLAIPLLRFKSKDLMDIPALVAMALQADGWYLRSDIIWHKPNPMPESVTDRPTSSHEHIFLLTKKPTYFYDAEAIAEPSEYPGDNRALRTDTRKVIDPMCADGGSRGRTGQPTGSTRNARNVWTIATQPFSFAHFATFPAELVERCVKAGTSEKGCCPTCWAPWERTITKGEPDETHRAASGADRSGGYNGQSTKNHDAAGVQNASDVKRRILEGMRLKTYGWQPTCGCPFAEPVPCTVLDPFSGAGTTALVADRLGRDAIGIDLNPTYGEMARNRLIADAGLFAEFG